MIDTAIGRLEQWRGALALDRGAPSLPCVEGVLAALASDLDAPLALRSVQAWVDATLGAASAVPDLSEAQASRAVRSVLDAALGLGL